MEYSAICIENELGRSSTRDRKRNQVEVYSCMNEMLRNFNQNSHDDGLVSGRWEVLRR